MLEAPKKIAKESVDWLLYKRLSAKQKQFLSSLLTQEQRRALKDLITPGRKRKQLQKLERLKYRLHNLGFTDKALADLEAAYKQEEEEYLQWLAAWELAVWHANQYTKEDAKKCIKILGNAMKGEKDPEHVRRAAILVAEAYGILGELEKGRQMIALALEMEVHPDLYLAAASLESSVAERMNWINKVFTFYGVSQISFDPDDSKSAYDRLGTELTETARQPAISANPKVSVIIPAYNAGEGIRTAIESVMAQTWTNLEILVVDDNSTDNTAEIAEEYEKKDNRVQVLRAEENRGAYAARNLALQIATGDFVTINDADDWSHPEKIAVQVEHLVKNPKVIGNFSQQARATNELKFYRRGKPGIYIFSNMSSFMFRREPAMEKLGYWDTVRFAGDSEFVKRMKHVYGERAVVKVPTAPFSFQRQSETSLTGDSAFGFPGYFMGVRKEYDEAHAFYRQQHPDKLRYDFPQERPFPIPEPMWPKREEKVNGRRHFDVVIASDFRLLGGTNMSNIEEIKAQKRQGLKTGLIQMYRYDINSVEDINPKVRQMLDGDRVQMLVYGEEISCDVLIVRHPPALEEWQKYIPSVKAKHVLVIINQPPKRDYSEQGGVLYDIPTTVRNLAGYVGHVGTWYPIGPKIRETLHEHHAEDLKAIKLAEQDWVNIIDVEEWKRAARPPKGETIKIGRHSRDQYVKWPADKEELLSVYPASSDYEIHVLGGAEAPEKVLGKLPENWHVHEFGKVEPKDFLAKLDVFVYYTHPDWVEAFGRVIFEAMAVGVPVIIPPHYEGLFGEAAIYAEPEEVQQKIKQLMSDDKAYEEQVNKAYAYVEENFGYSKHAARLEEFLDGSR